MNVEREISSGFGLFYILFVLICFCIINNILTLACRNFCVNWPIFNFNFVLGGQVDLKTNIFLQLARKKARNFFTICVVHDMLFLKEILFLCLLLKHVIMFEKGYVQLKCCYCNYNVVIFSNYKIY